MALVNRLSRLFQADFHAVLDRIEEPDLQLRQAVREMTFALEQDRHRLQLLRHEAGELERAAQQAGATLAGLDEELDLCLAADKEELARDLVRRKLLGERRLAALEGQSGKVGERITEVEQRLREQEQQLDSMQQKLELLAGAAATEDGGVPAPAETVRSEEIEIALLREKQRRAKA